MFDFIWRMCDAGKHVLISIHPLFVYYHVIFNSYIVTVGFSS